MEIESILIVTHVIGTIIGVGAATLLEPHLRRTLKDGNITDDERGILAVDYRMMRIGLIVCLVSGLGFLLVDKFEGNTKYLYSPRLWAKILFVVIIAANTLLLQARAINLYWGSAFSFVSWWAAALVGVFVTGGIKFDFFGEGGFITTFASLMSIYALAVVLGAIVLHAFRNKKNI